MVSLSSFKVLKHMVFIFNCKSGLQKLCANCVIALLVVLISAGTRPCAGGREEIV